LVWLFLADAPAPGTLRTEMVGPIGDISQPP
jgi:hypothetical protein